MHLELQWKDDYQAVDLASDLFIVVLDQQNSLLMDATRAVTVSTSTLTSPTLEMSSMFVSFIVTSKSLK